MADFFSFLKRHVSVLSKILFYFSVFIPFSLFILFLMKLLNYNLIFNIYSISFISFLSFSFFLLTFLRFKSKIFLILPEDYYLNIHLSEEEKKRKLFRRQTFSFFFQCFSFFILIILLFLSSAFDFDFWFILKFDNVSKFSYLVFISFFSLFLSFLIKRKNILFKLPSNVVTAFNNVKRNTELHVLSRLNEKIFWKLNKFFEKIGWSGILLLINLFFLQCILILYGNSSATSNFFYSLFLIFDCIFAFLFLINVILELLIFILVSLPNLFAEDLSKENLIRLGEPLVAPVGSRLMRRLGIIFSAVGSGFIIANKFHTDHYPSSPAPAVRIVGNIQRMLGSSEDAVNKQLFESAPANAGKVYVPGAPIEAGMEQDKFFAFRKEIESEIKKEFLANPKFRALSTSEYIEYYDRRVKAAWENQRLSELEWKSQNVSEVDFSESLEKDKLEINLFFESKVEKNLQKLGVSTIDEYLIKRKQEVSNKLHKELYPEPLEESGPYNWSTKDFNNSYKQDNKKLSSDYEK